MSCRLGFPASYRRGCCSCAGGGSGYVKMFGRSSSCLLAPSEISYTPAAGAGDLGPPTEQEDTIAASLLLCKLPKMQVTEKDGRWFALNNASLRLFRRLEYEGKCSKVSAEVVPLTKIPPRVREAMANAPESPRIKKNTRTIEKISKTEDAEAEELGQATKKGYHKVVCDAHQDADDQLRDCSDVTSSSCSDEEDTQLEDLDDDSEGEYEDEDALTCNVCDRSFASTRQMASHQQRRRHFSCSVCETLFPALSALENHKETLDHWSEDDDEDEEDEEEDEDDEEQLQADNDVQAGDKELRKAEEADDEATPDSESRRKSWEQERLL